MNKNKLLNTIIVISLILIFISLIFSICLYFINDNNIITINFLNNTDEIIEVNNTSLVPNITYNYPVLINTKNEGKYKIYINILNDSINKLEKSINIEILFSNNVLYNGELQHLINNPIIFENFFLKDKIYELDINYYIIEDNENDLENQLANFDIVINVKKGEC